MIDYKPILIHWNDWQTMSFDDREEHLDGEVKRALA